MSNQPTERWTEEIESFKRRIRSIVMSPDLNPGMAREIQSRLSELYDEVRPIYGKIKTQDSEIQRLLYRVETKNRIGPSESVRRSNGVRALENYTKEDGTAVNLFDIEAESRKKKEDMEMLLDMIEKKKEALITFQLLFKVEASLA